MQEQGIAWSHEVDVCGRSRGWCPLVCFCYTWGVYHSGG